MKKLIISLLMLCSLVTYADNPKNITLLTDALILIGNINVDELDDADKVSFSLGMAKIGQAISQLSRGGDIRERYWRCRMWSRINKPVNEPSFAFKWGRVSRSREQAEKYALDMCDVSYFRSTCVRLMDRFECKVVNP